MENIAVIFAGGTGQRMNSRTKPKQFLELHGKPILVYTLEVFQRCEIIDRIVLVMLKEWIPYSQELIAKYHLTKVAAVVAGGGTGQESIFNGISKAKEIASSEACVLIHDGVRPIIDEDTIERCVESVETYGNAITVIPAIETIAIKGDDGDTIGKILPRSECLMARAPQCFRLNDIYNCHLNARKEQLADFIDSASLMQHYGYTLHAVVGHPENIKITTPSDFYIFRAILDAQENSQIFG